MAQGRCNCGEVAFEVDGSLQGVIVCHCSICRRYTGANGIAVLLAPNAAFRWLRGEDQITTWHKPNGAWSAHFCSICGSALPGPNSETNFFIPAGSLVRGDDELRVTDHVFVDSRAPWDEIGDAGLKHPEAYGTGVAAPD